jgi:hypothetical protein
MRYYVNLHFSLDKVVHIVYDNDIMKLSPFTPSTRQTSQPGFKPPGLSFSAGLQGLKQAEPVAAFKDLKPANRLNDQRFLFNYNGQAIMGGGRLNAIG